MEEVFVTKTIEETQLLAQNFGKKLQGGDVVLLYGDLGAGKTTFTQGLAKGIGVKKQIISPTFIIMRTYEIKHGNFYHVDLYRLQSEKEIEGIGLIELMGKKDAIVVIEWPERLGRLKSKKYTEIYFEQLSEHERQIKIQNNE